MSDHSMDPQPVHLPHGTGTALGTAAGAVAGAVAGGVVGLVAGPAGLAIGAVAGAAVGAGAGSRAGRWADRQDQQTLAKRRREDGPAAGEPPSPQDVIGAEPESSMPGGPNR